MYDVSLGEYPKLTTHYTGKLYFYITKYFIQLGIFLLFEKIEERGD